MKRVVITGIGVVSCLGNNQEEVYQSLINSRSGITFSEEYKEYNLKSHVHGLPKIKLEDNFSFINLLFNKEIYLPLILFLIVMLISFIIKKKIFSDENK